MKNTARKKRIFIDEERGYIRDVFAGFRKVTKINKILPFLWVFGGAIIFQKMILTDPKK